MQAARHARETFGDDAGVQLAETLRLVGEAAAELGIDVGSKVRALLDAHSATFAGEPYLCTTKTACRCAALGWGQRGFLSQGFSARQ